MDQIQKYSHLLCPTCKTEIGHIKMMMGTLEIQDLVVTCHGCSTVCHEKDIIVSSSPKFRQNERFKKYPPAPEGC